MAVDAYNPMVPNATARHRRRRRRRVHPEHQDLRNRALPLFARTRIFPAVLPQFRSVVVALGRPFHSPVPRIFLSLPQKMLSDSKIQQIVQDAINPTTGCLPTDFDVRVLRSMFLILPAARRLRPSCLSDEAGSS